MGISGLLSTNPRLRPISQLYLLIIAVWFVLVTVLIGFTLRSELNQNRQQFQRNADALFEQLSNKVEINESIIEGFASLLASSHQYQWGRTRKYAQRILQRYPHIYMFEIARRVEYEQLPEFVSEIRRNTNADYRIGQFDFSDRRQWLNVPQRESYYPIIFMEPMRMGSREILGLDLGANELFRTALYKSARLDMPVATAPFTLLEGMRGFLLQRPVSRNRTEKLAEQYAILVIKARELLPAKLMGQDQLTAHLYHRDDNNDTELYYKPGTAVSDLEQNLFPRLKYEQATQNPGQPFVLVLEKQIGFADINVNLIIAILVVGVLSFWTVMVFSRMHHRNEMQRLQYENRLYHLANNDALTGLVNRNYFIDRLRQVLARARRKEHRFALVFMDMNNFKKINDDYGHAAGDALLQDVAIRFKDCMREEDTVCRYQGDEFIILLEEFGRREEMTHIQKKLQECLEAPFLIHGHEVYASVSIGVAIFPDDGETLESLLQVVDQNMYRNKRNAAR